MLLNDGIATIYKLEDVSEAGGTPRYERTVKAESYYAELSYETSPVNPTEGRTERRIDARVRIRQYREIREDDHAALESFHEEKKSERLYRIVRVFHGIDEESALPISDLSLEEVGKS